MFGTDASSADNLQDCDWMLVRKKYQQILEGRQPNSHKKKKENCKILFPVSRDK